MSSTPALVKAHAALQPIVHGKYGAGRLQLTCCLQCLQLPG